MNTDKSYVAVIVVAVASAGLSPAVLLATTRTAYSRPGVKSRIVCARNSKRDTRQALASYVSGSSHAPRPGSFGLTLITLPLILDTFITHRCVLLDMLVVGPSATMKYSLAANATAVLSVKSLFTNFCAQAWRAEKPLARVAANQSVIAEYTRGAGAQRSGRSRKLFLVANVWIYLVECALLVLKTLFPGQKMVLFELEYGFVALCFFMLAVMLARCALQLRAVLLRIELSALAATIASTLSLIGAVSITLLLPKLAAALLMAAIDVFDPHVSNPWLFYAIPELIPGALVIYMMNVKRQQQPAPPAWGITKADEQTPLLQELRRLSNDLPHFHGQELHI